MTKEKIENYDDVLNQVEDAIANKKLVFNNHANRNVTLYSVAEYPNDNTTIKATSSVFDSAIRDNEGHIYYDTDTAVANVKSDNKQNYLVILSCAKDLAKHRYSKYLKDPAAMTELIEQLPIKVLAAVDPDMRESVTFSMLLPITPNYNAIYDNELCNQFHRSDMGRINSYFDQKIKQINLTCKQMKEIWALRGENTPIVYRYKYALVGQENQLCFYNFGYGATEARNAYSIFNETIARYAAINLKPMFKGSQMYVLIKKGAGSWWVKYARELNHNDYYNEMIKDYTNSLAYDNDSNNINKIITSFVFDYLPLACFNSNNNYSFYNGYVAISDTDAHDPRYKEIEFHSKYDLKLFDSRNVCGRSDWQLIDNDNSFYSLDQLATFELDLPKFDSSLPYQLSQTDLLGKVVNSRKREYVDINPNETKALSEIFNMISLTNPRQKAFIENHTLVALLGTDNIKEIDINPIDQSKNKTGSACFSMLIQFIFSPAFQEKQLTRIREKLLPTG